MERQVSTIHINKFVDLPDGSTVQIVASGPLLTFLVIQKQQNGSRVLYGFEDKGWKVHLVPYEVSSRGQILKNTKSSIITTLKHFKIKIKAEQLMFKQLSKIALLSTFSIFHAYQTKEWVSPPLLKPWLIQNWLAVGSGSPCNDFVWPIVLNLCSLLSLYQC